MSNKQPKRITLELKQASEGADCCELCSLSIENCGGCAAGSPTDCGRNGYWALVPEAPQ